jgi:MtN3 and saliva related transmembrane protein
LSANEIIGFIGGALVNYGFIPQVVRVLRLGSIREITFPFTILLLSGTVCWLLYGLWQNLLAVIFWNAILLVLAIVLLYAKLEYGFKKPEPKS